MIRGAEVYFVEDLLDLSVEAEQTVECTKKYRTSPTPESTLLPEMVYRPPLEPRLSKANVGAVAPANCTAKSANLEPLVRK